MYTLLAHPLAASSAYAPLRADIQAALARAGVIRAGHVYL